MWGYLYVRYTPEGRMPFVQYLLSRGLKKVYQITQANTYEERYDLIHPMHYPNTNRNFLRHWLNRNGRLNNFYKPYALMEVGSTDHVNTLWIRPFFEDPDHGPIHAWRWAHTRGMQINDQKVIYSPECRLVRQWWAYVFWDHSRLLAAGILSTPFDWRGDLQLGSHMHRQETGRFNAHQRGSWPIRSNIFRYGGRGWWNWGNHN